jgi:hypothetical protein
VLIETPKLWDQALCVFPVDLDRTGDEEILLLACTRLPIVRLRDRDNKSKPSCPRPVLRLAIIFRWQSTVREALDRAQFFQIPRLANAETAVVVLPCLVHADSSSAPYRDYDEPRLPILGRTVGRWRRRRVYGVFLDPNMGDVALAQLAIGVDLAEAGLDNAPFLVLEAFGARRSTRRGWTLLRLRRTQTRLWIHGAVGAGHVEGRVGAIARVAVVAVWRRARHGTGREGVSGGDAVFDDIMRRSL